MYKNKPRIIPNHASDAFTASHNHKDLVNRSTNARVKAPVISELTTTNNKILFQATFINEYYIAWTGSSTTITIMLNASEKTKAYQSSIPQETWSDDQKIKNWEGYKPRASSIGGKDRKKLHGSNRKRGKEPFFWQSFQYCQSAKSKTFCSLEKLVKDFRFNLTCLQELYNLASDRIS